MICSNHASFGDVVEYIKTCPSYKVKDLFICRGSRQEGSKRQDEKANNKEEGVLLASKSSGLAFERGDQNYLILKNACKNHVKFENEQDITMVISEIEKRLAWDVILEKDKEITENILPWLRYLSKHFDNVIEEKTNETVSGAASIDWVAAVMQCKTSAKKSSYFYSSDSIFSQRIEKDKIQSSSSKRMKDEVSFYSQSQNTSQNVSQIVDNNQNDGESKLREEKAQKIKQMISSAIENDSGKIPNDSSLNEIIEFVSNLLKDPVSELMNLKQLNLFNLHEESLIRVTQRLISKDNEYQLGLPSLMIFCENILLQHILAQSSKVGSPMSRAFLDVLESAASIHPQVVSKGLIFPLISYREGANAEFPLPSHCEMSIRIIKSHFTSDLCVDLLHLLITNNMKWNDSTISVLTQIISKIPASNTSHLETFIQELEVAFGSNTGNLANSSKFSNLILLLVNTYGASLRPYADGLRRVLLKCTSITSKPAKNLLEKKLQ